MIIILIILSLLLGGYSLYLIKKLDKETKVHLNNIKIKLHEKGLYLLDELDNKIKTNEELLLNKLSKINNKNQEINKKFHNQLISNEFKKLKSDINKDLDDIVESVKNIKVF